ncbi:hypothetical protein [Streptomyces violascens]|uniref:hypothetical protein n=1 Tax=Streptomyces violascens TaxID=67381 RepID=UPI001671D4AE|nr:hypothetical protein [Streptomyces violascens]
MKIDRPALARLVRTLLGLADRLHPAALLILVLVLVGLVYAAAPVLVTLLTALVTVLKAGAFLGGGVILGRLAVRAAATYRSTPPPAGPSAATA